MSDGQFQQPEMNDEATIASVFGLDDVPSAEAPSAPTPAAPAGEPAAAPAAPAETPPAAPAAPAPAAPVQEVLPPLAAPTPAPSPAPSPAAPAAPAAPAPTSDDALRAASQAAQIEALQAEITRLRQPQPGAPAAAPTPTAPSGDEAPSYALSIPDQLATAIFSEDPVQARQGLTHLVNSLAVHVHQTVRQEFQQRLAAQEQARATADSTAQEAQAAAQMQQDYYGAFPAHNNPTVKAIVAQVAAELSAEYPMAPWNAQYRDSLGSRVNARLASLGAAPAQPAPAPAPTPAPAPAPRPAAFAPTTPRSGIPDFGNEGQGDLISDTFSFGE